ncbi:hypothetical protein D805_0050 [Bifidobacterium thermophilum RBL67]|uniref:Uncharacterized protein n=1 Tax=Bifidobacterium thermophilum RBL67 TaxID=1254439 RepID=M4RP04_9BIFI|nr:hypothetical protein D805_0050 [Bifidobacterium thermophilum RBL67]
MLICHDHSFALKAQVKLAFIVKVSADNHHVHNKWYSLI